MQTKVAETIYTKLVQAPAWQKLHQALDHAPLLQRQGELTQVSHSRLCACVPQLRLGELVRIKTTTGIELEAEVYAFAGDEALLAPLGPITALAPKDPVYATGHPFRINCSNRMLGRVLDGLGQPLDGGEALDGVPWEVQRPPPPPLQRPRICQRFPVGVRSIDALLTLGYGQRVGLFAGSGVGKSTLLGQIARQAQAQVLVIGLIGERGREVREFIEDALGPATMARAVIVCATSDQPPLVRHKSAHVCMAIAEWFRDQGREVLLLVDSLTRFARASRDVALAAGEMPVRRGFPASVFAMLPQWLERAGPAPKGQITALFTVLVEGSDMEEPVADELRALLDGHIVLSRHLAERGRYPAIDPLQSISRLLPQLLASEQQQRAAQLRQWLAAYEGKRELITLGAYQRGSDPVLDQALQNMPKIEAFLRQGRDETSSWQQTMRDLQALVSTETAASVGLPTMAQ